MSLLSLRPRLTRQLLYWSWRAGFPIGCLLATGLSHNGAYGAFGLLWIFIGHWPSYWYTLLILPLLITRLRCRRCRLEVNAVSIWTSGGYTDHRERHVLRFKGPDGARIGHIACPQCGSSILL